MAARLSQATWGDDQASVPSSSSFSSYNPMHFPPGFGTVVSSLPQQQPPQQQQQQQQQQQPKKIAVTTTKSTRPCYSESEVDDYAQQVLESRASQTPDQSLGSYVTSMLRSSDNEKFERVQDLPDFESLLELIVEHCVCSESEALESLKAIAEAVRTRQIPFDEKKDKSSGIPLNAVALHTQYTTASHLINNNNINNNHRNGVVFEEEEEEEEASALVDETAFPPLASAATATSTNKKKHHHGGRSRSGSMNSHNSGGSGSNNSSSNNKKTQSATDLAAALFVGPITGSRQGNLSTGEDAAASSPLLNPVKTSDPPPGLAASAAACSNSIVDEQLCASTVEMLLSMNAEVAEPAALAATKMAPQHDVNIAQYLIDCVLNAAPVCRHLLNDGCYRSDCQFSHDIDTHTCLFWLRGRCGKGAHCRFLHGFSPVLLQDIVPTYSSQSSPQPQPALLHHQQPSLQHARYGSGSSSFSSSGVSGNQQQTSTATTTNQQQQAALFPALNAAAPSFPSPTLAKSSSSTTTKKQKPAAQGAWGNATKNPTSFASIIAKKPPPSSAVTAESARAWSSSPSPLANNNTAKPKKVDIPQDVWSAHENRDASAFYIADPMERYRVVSGTRPTRQDVVDLHFQSTKTFGVVLQTVLPSQLETCGNVWIVTGTGHHVGSKTHQKGGGALESAVMKWLTDHGYDFAKGRDRNGQSGAILVYNNNTT